MSVLQTPLSLNIARSKTGIHICEMQHPFCLTPLIKCLSGHFQECIKSQDCVLANFPFDLQQMSNLKLKIENCRAMSGSHLMNYEILLICQDDIDSTRQLATIVKPQITFVVALQSRRYDHLCYLKSAEASSCKSIAVSAQINRVKYTVAISLMHWLIHLDKQFNELNKKTNPVQRQHLV